MEKDYIVILYYKYIPLEKPEVIARAQRTLCETLGLKGRIIFAKEGINGTLCGEKEAIQNYISETQKIPEFSNIVFKKSVGHEGTFDKLKIKVRSEIVALNLTEDIDPNELTGERLKPEELKQWIKSGKDFHIVDIRNDYEYVSGHFKGSIGMPMENFRDLPKVVSKIHDLKDKPVVTVCTGGVRCEKASGFLKREGFQNVFQLDGGIVTYMEKYPAQDFAGTLYVFDNRITMDFEKNHEVVGKCKLCQKQTENYTNCADATCHDHFLYCGCELNSSQNGIPFCSDSCRNKIEDIHSGS
ncbi:rhodanese-related sulfurtransferase [Candidatus Parcubacteria bacterium]|nr:rhodanese-related sulfurtransferase [Candidatus Parcubacteria bacterium]